MLVLPRCRRWHRALAVALAAVATLALSAPAAQAAPPTLGPLWASEVSATSARLHTDVNPNGQIGFYHFEFITLAAYEANLAAAKEPFAGALKAPSGSEPSVGAGTTAIVVSQQLTNLLAETTYRYRTVAKSAGGTTASEPHAFTTRAFGGDSVLLDGRGWEMVSPVDKNGGEVAAPETIAGGGVLQAAAGGDAVTYSSATSFGEGAQGAPAGSQYVSRRSTGGWNTENITTPMLSGSYGAGAVGVPYQIFSADLSHALLLNGRHCRGEGTECPVANPPLAGSGAPAGYQDYYLRSSSPLGFTALVRAPDLAHASLDASHFDLALAGASEDLGQVVLASCAALAANATEVPAGEGCDPDATNLYRYSGGALTLVNLLPAQSTGAPGAALAARSGAVSTSGSRVYWNDLAGGNLYLREGSITKQVDAAAGGGGAFQTASPDGAVAFFAKAGHLWRYEATSSSAADLTPGGGMLGMLGAAADGSYLYYLTGEGLFVRHGATVTKIATSADSTGYPPSTGTARVSTDGTRLAFTSTAPLTGYDNTDQKGGGSDAEVYLYDASGAGSLVCISCNPTGARPLGPSSLPATVANGQLAGALQAYRPRSLSADGRRLFFDSSDALALSDTDNAPDAYEWEAQGTGSCTRQGGCLALISSGKGAEGASFIDASANGADAFFLTASSLVPADPGSADVYDARIGGGFAVPSPPLTCEGDACQSLPSPPEDRTVNTLVAGPGNRAVRYPKQRKGAHHRKKHNRHAHHKKRKGKGGGR